MTQEIKNDEILVNDNDTYCGGCGRKIPPETPAFIKVQTVSSESEVFCCVECREKPEQGC